MEGDDELIGGGVEGDEEKIREEGKGNYRRRAGELTER